VIEEYHREVRSAQVLRLVALPRERLETILTERGIAFDDLEDVKAALVGVGAVLTAEDAVAYTFSREVHLPQRFNTAEFPAFYSALGKDTCIAEVKYHLSALVSTAFPRYYHFLEVAFNGTALVLCGHQGDHPELISASNSGYPFCQELAAAARQDGIDALYAPSARHSGGICVPVFHAHVLSSPQITGSLRFLLNETAFDHEMISQ
jgi:hypothetical protein